MKKIIPELMIVAGALLGTVCPGSAALTAHYRFNGDLADETGRHPGKLCDRTIAPRFDLGKSGDALVIDSAGSAVEAENCETIDFCRDFTIAAWVNTTYAGEQVIVFKGHPAAFQVPDKQFNLMGSQGMFIYGQGQGQWGANYSRTHRVQINDGSWHHVAVSYRANKSPHFTIYLDGIPKRPGEEGSFMNGDFIMQPEAPQSVLRIGGRADKEYPYYRGLLDEVQIYDEALEPDQIQFLYQHPGGDAQSKIVPQFHPSARLMVDAGHPWRPPFGLERVGRPLDVVVKLAAEKHPLPEYWLAGYRQGVQIERKVLPLTGTSPFTVKLTMVEYPDELVLFQKGGQGEPIELARQAVTAPEFEAEAIARPDTIINPVDLGTILAPSDWLLLAVDQPASVDVAALCRRRDPFGASVTAWFETAASAKTSMPVTLSKGRRIQVNLRLPAAPPGVERDNLWVAIVAGNGKPLWRKKIQTMLVRDRPRWPKFGATETKLRFDAPISILSESGELSAIPYSEGWKPELNDVIVSLPNGSRFVFWRGSSYVPFWVSRFNTAFCYEWAETGGLPDAKDCVEPLMDKELRYGRVRIVEATAARVHVRWTYQSCDFDYKVWGDSAAEDFYLYPDGFGTRVLTIQSAPDADYELSEFIILTPQAAYPLSVLPSNLVDVLFLDGHKRELRFPFNDQEQPDARRSRGIAAIYRVRLNKDDPMAAVYFNPHDQQLPPAIFAPFHDRGYLVTPCYWGSHWPLGRGKTTGWTIDDRIYVSPAHNSVMSWARSRPPPIRTSRLETLDTLGRSRTMIQQQWTWLIGMSDASDDRLLQWARSFAKPPSLEIRGGQLDFDSYVPERRAICLKIEDSMVEMTLKPWQSPKAVCVNPVFELRGAQDDLAKVTMAGRALVPDEYAWDGKTLWLNVTLTNPTQLELRFGKPKE